MTRKTSAFGMMALLLLLFLFSIKAQQTLADPSAASLQLPIFANFNDGATGWIVFGGWRRSEIYRFGSSGMGWGIEREFSFPINTLGLNSKIDLTTAVAPRVRFASNISSPIAYSFASVDIIVNGIHQKRNELHDISGFWTDIVIDLTSYRGSVIELRWSFMPRYPDTIWMIDNVVIEDSAVPTPSPTVIVPTGITPTGITPTVITPTVITPTVITPTVITPTVITPTVITPTLPPAGPTSATSTPALYTATSTP